LAERGLGLHAGSGRQPLQRVVGPRALERGQGGDHGDRVHAGDQIAKTKTATDKEFFLGYVNSTYDSSAYRFEGAFFGYLANGTPHTRTVAAAFAYAMSVGGYSIPDAANPFTPNWWGNPNYDGMALW
jgi:hypothetical protein